MKSVLMLVIFVTCCKGDVKNLIQSRSYGFPYVYFPYFDQSTEENFPPSIEPPVISENMIFLPAQSPNINQNLNVQVYNMSCSDRFFRSAIKTANFIDFSPVIDNANSDCIFGSGDTFLIDVQEGNKFNQCGIRYCTDEDQLHFCLPLRIPTIKGLKLPEDQLIILRCKPQAATSSQTKHFKFNQIVNNVEGRNRISTVATGGLQKNLETEIVLYKKLPGTNEFSQVINSGSSVDFGEELLLKATVNEGDGWKYSKMGLVTVQRAPFNGNSDTITMIDDTGCRVPTMRAVCPEQPRKSSPLVTTFPFRAFMFQGENTGGEMVLSVKMAACLHHEDCMQNRLCEESRISGRTKAKREISLEKIGNETIDLQNYFAFKVIVPENRKLHKTGPTITLIALIGVLITALFFAVCIIINNRASIIVK